MNMTFLSVVKPPIAIYHGCSTWKTLWEENSAQVNITICGRRNVRRHREINKGDKYIILDICYKQTKRGVTQVHLVSPTIFNIVVDAVVRSVLMEFCIHQEAQHGFKLAAGEHNIYFYVDDMRIAGRNPIWVQTALTAMVRIFERLVLQKNMSKTKSMVCTPGFIWVQQGVESYK